MMINPNDISDAEVRQWYEKRTESQRFALPSMLSCSVKQRKERRWLMPTWKALIEREYYISWAFRNIFAYDSVIFVNIDSSVEKLNDRLKNVVSQNHKIISVGEDVTPSDFLDIIDENNINLFFSHANFSNAVLMMRHQLLQSDTFDQVLSVWHEGGFLRHVCFQLDWMGWNALSSLAALDIERVPPLSLTQCEFLRYFMNEFFVRNKIHYTRRSRFFTCEESVRQLFKTTRPVAVIPLQVHRDSVIVHFSDDEEYISLSWAFQFAEKHPDYFFVVIDHPLQRNFDHAPDDPIGANWIYLPHTTKIDTTSLCKHADAVVTVNSTVAFEALYWTPIFRAGKSVYSHDLVSCPIEDFPHGRCKRDDIERFLYYAITRFHYSPQVNCNTHREWIDVLQENRYNYCSISPLKNLEPPLLEDLKTDVPDLSFLSIPCEKDTDRIRAGKMAERFVDEIVPYSEVLDVGGDNVLLARFLHRMKRAKTTIVDIKEVKCTDYFTSSIQGDFMDFSIDRKFDGIWASHILEHVVNVGQFLKQFIRCSKEEAVCAIAVPVHYRTLVGGHINFFSPATLCYNVILAGQNLQNAIIIIDEQSTALLWRRNDLELPALNYDKGDIEILQDYFPVPVHQGIDGFAGWEKDNLI